MWPREAKHRIGVLCNRPTIVSVTPLLKPIPCSLAVVTGSSSGFYGGTMRKQIVLSDDYIFKEQRCITIIINRQTVPAAKIDNHIITPDDH